MNTLQQKIDLANKRLSYLRYLMDILSQNFDSDFEIGLYQDYYIQFGVPFLTPIDYFQRFFDEHCIFYKDFITFVEENY